MKPATAKMLEATFTAVGASPCSALEVGNKLRSASKGWGYSPSEVKWALRVLRSRGQIKKENGGWRRININGYKS